MKVYIGNVGTLRILKLMKEEGWGNVLLANALRTPKDGINWILDNGAYSCWINHKPFDSKAFEDSLIKIEGFKSKPDFVVVPDIVAGGLKSLYFSLGWVHKIPAHHNIYLAVQDGMTIRDVLEYINWFDGIFVGGTLEWKLKNGKTFVEISHSQNKKCHIGRVGTFKRLLWAKRIGCDSIDSSTFVQCGTYGKIKAIETQTALY